MKLISEEFEKPMVYSANSKIAKEVKKMSNPENGWRLRPWYYVPYIPLTHSNSKDTSSTFGARWSTSEPVENYGGKDVKSKEHVENYGGRVVKSKEHVRNYGGRVVKSKEHVRNYGGRVV